MHPSNHSPRVRVRPQEKGRSAIPVGLVTSRGPEWRAQVSVSFMLLVPVEWVPVVQELGKGSEST